MALPSVILVIVVICLIVSNQNTKARKQLWSAYQQALNSGDRAAALRAGRAYYAKLRGGRLTIYDEQALTNDLSTMK
jgi:hypothetical protein